MRKKYIKSRIQETPNLSTNAENSHNNFFWNKLWRKKIQSGSTPCFKALQVGPQMHQLNTSHAWSIHGCNLEQLLVFKLSEDAPGLLRPRTLPPLRTSVWRTPKGDIHLCGQNTLNLKPLLCSFQNRSYFHGRYNKKKGISTEKYIYFIFIFYFFYKKWPYLVVK